MSFSGTAIWVLWCFHPNFPKAGGTSFTKIDQKASKRMTDTQYLTKSLRFLSGYLSFDDVVLASVLFLFGLVLSSEQHSLLELLGLGFRTECISLSHNRLEFLSEEGLLSCSGLDHFLHSQRRRNGDDPAGHLSCLFKLCPPSAAPSWNKELVTRPRSWVCVPVSEEKACFGLGYVNLCPKGHSSDFYRGRKVVERSSKKQQWKEQKQKLANSVTNVD